MHSGQIVIKEAFNTSRPLEEFYRVWPSMFIRLFTDFLEKEFSAENIMFWVACQEYKNNTGKKVIF
jgi:hypothetical protein